MGVLMPITNNLICANTIPTSVICCLIAGIVVALVFIVAFFLELMTPVKRYDERRSESKTEDFDIDEMLSKLEQSASKVEKVEKEKIEEEKFNQTKILAPLEELQEVKAQPQPIIQPEPEVKEEETNKDFDFDALFAKIESELKESKNSEPEPVEVKQESPVEVVMPDVVQQEEKTEQVVETKTIVETVTVEEEPRIVGPEFDYNVRLETINNSLAKLEKDLAKATKEVNKFEKTEKRKARSEKLLDRKATELTNLNLVLYNVNDIKDIDPEKKQKQESLVEHIGELKSTIAEANEYIAKNKEKYDNSKKIKTFLEGEKARYNEEITELNMLIEQAKKGNK